MLGDRRLGVEPFEHVLETALAEKKEALGNEAFILARLRGERGRKENTFEKEEETEKGEKGSFGWR